MEWSEELAAFARDYANWNGPTAASVTFDVDFAPDYMIEHVLGILERFDAKATFFATHDSPLLRDLAATGHHEVALHPYTGPGTTQGAGLENIVARLREAYPEAEGTRFHVLHHSYRDLAVLGRLGLRYDVSTLRFNTPFLLPAWHADIGLVLLTYNWEDGISENARVPLRIETVDLVSPGTKIFNFHPMNVYINGPDATQRLNFMQANPDLLRCPQEVSDRHRHSGPGAESFLMQLLEELQRAGTTVYKVKDVAGAYMAASGARETAGRP